MKELKSAYELATERIIAPPEHMWQEEAEEDFVEPMDFIQPPQGPLPAVGTAEYSSAFIDQRNTQDKLNKKALDAHNKGVNNMQETTVENAQTIHYDGTNAEVHWGGNFLDYGGFARLNRNMAFGLSNRNFKVKVDIDPYITHVNPSTQKQLKELSHTQISDNAPKVFGVTVPLNINHPGYKILYTMIETSNKVHPDYAGKLNMVNEVWVPTEYGKKILQASGVRSEIRVMPLGVDVDRYTPEVKPINIGVGLKSFRFISVFRWGYRKGYDLLLKAYMEEFSAQDDVSLLMVSRPVNVLEERGEEQIVADFNGIKTAISKSEEELPHIALYNKPIPEGKMPHVYALGNAFALISRGEGFGLPYCEAGAMDMPVIASHCSGHSDYLTDDNSFLVEPEGYAVADRLSRLGKGCRFYEDQEFPEFNRDSIDTVKANMRFVFEHYDLAKMKAKNLGDFVRANYTWPQAIDRACDRLLEIQN